MAESGVENRRPLGQMLIVLAGLPGTGKSELAKRLGRELGVSVLSVDPIESAILRAGIPRGFTTGLAAYLVVETLADSALELGLGAIVDAVNAVEPAKEMWRKLAKKHRLTLKIIECWCTDEGLHRERLGARRRGLDNFPEPTWEQVKERRREYTRWTEPILSVDAVASFESNVKRALDWIGQPDVEDARSASE